jgi:hypothetical protein
MGRDSVSRHEGGGGASASETRARRRSRSRSPVVSEISGRRARDWRRSRSPTREQDRYNEGDRGSRVDSRGGAEDDGRRSPSHKRQRQTALEKWPSPSPRPESTSEDYVSRRSHGGRHQEQYEDDHYQHQQQDYQQQQPSTSQRHRKRVKRPTTKRDPAASGAGLKELPFDARGLSRNDFATFRPLFAHYLDLQKGLQLNELPEDEVRGRWKSFRGKWNRGELAAGWYDPEIYLQAAHDHGHGDDDAAESDDQGRGYRRGGHDDDRVLREESVVSETRVKEDLRDDGSDSDEDNYGPSLPPSKSEGRQKAHGPGIPSLDDLEARREGEAEDHAARLAHLSLERKADRKVQKERLEELAPRAEAGTRERRLEKKQEVNNKMRQFRDKSPGAAEVGDNDLMGGGADGEGGVAEYKRMLATAEKRKTQREVRREEIARARAEEHAERMAAYRAKEEKTVDMLRELARQRFG